MMLQLVALTLVALLEAQAIPATSRPDFSGTWSPAPGTESAFDLVGMTGGGGDMTIVQGAAQVTFQRLFMRGTVVFQVKLDGSESIHADPLKHPVVVAEVLTRASWKGATLVLDTTRIVTAADGRVSRSGTREVLSLDLDRLVVDRSESAEGQPEKISRRVYVRRK